VPIALPTSTELFLASPELWLMGGMCAVILVPFINRTNDTGPTYVSILALVLALASAFRTLPDLNPGTSIFHGMLTVDQFSQFVKILLILFTLFVVVQWMVVSRHRTHHLDAPDYHCLLLGATFGMCLMASASNLLMLFIAVETASLPSFALAGFRKRHRVGTEIALKYVLFGAASSAIMIYGMSLVYGMCGTLTFAGIADVATVSIPPLLAVGLVAMFAGIAFKLSAVPLHFWCPDVFQGAPFEITTFLSVASKGAAIALLTRLLFIMGAATAPGDHGFGGLFFGIAALGAVTATWGNLLAYHQTNVKRLLAYSSIAHAGYMIMAASLMTKVNAASDPTLATTVGGAILFYLLVYVFMNLGAFTLAAVIAAGYRGDEGESLESYAGLIRRSPLVTVLMAIFLLSLFGLPGLGGFMGKFFLMQAMSDAAGGTGIALIAILLVNTLISLYYYLRPVYFMVFRVPESESTTPVAVPHLATLIVTLCAAGILWTGLLPGAVGQETRNRSAMLLVPKAPLPKAAAKASMPPSKDAAPIETHSLRP